MKQNVQNNNTDALRHCEGGTTKSIQRNKPLVWIASFLAITLGLFTSCEKEIEFNGEQTDSRLVINSIVTPGHRVEARIGKSYFFLDPANTATPDDLVATLYVNGNRVGEMMPFLDTIWEMYWPYDYELVSGFYNDYCPQEGDIVKITASANGFEDVEGTTSALPKDLNCPMEVELIDCHSGYIYHYNDEIQDYETDSSVLVIAGYMNLTFTITDPNPGKTDCFRLITSRSSNMSIGDNRRYIYFDYDDPIFETGMTENEFFDASDLDTRPEGVFTDVLFDGSSYRIKVKASFDCELAEDFDPDFYRVPFIVEHLSKEYYHYLNTCDQGDVALQIYAEPIHTFSNVTNGFGIVGGRAVDTLWLELPIER